MSPGRVERRAGEASTPEESPSPGGLVPCAITVRDHEKGPDWSLRSLWTPAFPAPELVRAAADLLPSIQAASWTSATLSEGPRWEVVVSPGVIRVRTRDYARAERASERRRAHNRAQADMAASFLVEGKNVSELLPVTYRYHLLYLGGRSAHVVAIDTSIRLQYWHLTVGSPPSWCSEGW